MMPPRNSCWPSPASAPALATLSRPRAFSSVLHPLLLPNLNRLCSHQVSRVPAFRLGAAMVTLDDSAEPARFARQQLYAFDDGGAAVEGCSPDSYNLSTTADTLRRCGFRYVNRSARRRDETSTQPNGYPGYNSANSIACEKQLTFLSKPFHACAALIRVAIASMAAADRRERSVGEN
jgi:hypothetical protein